VRYQAGTALQHEATTVDLGLGGAFLQTAHSPPIGSEVTLFLTAPTAWDTLEIRCVVRWMSDGSDGRPIGFGVKFGQLSGGQATALYELLQTVEFEPD